MKDGSNKLLATGKGAPTQDESAKLVVAALMQKQEAAKRIKGDSYTADDVIQLWNGVGSMSERHISRVKEADRLLRTDPGNKQLKELWEGIVGALPTSSVDEQSAQATSTILKSMIDDYDSNK